MIFLSFNERKNKCTLSGAFSQEFISVVNSIPVDGKWVGVEYVFEISDSALTHLKNNIPDILFDDKLSKLYNNESNKKEQQTTIVEETHEVEYKFHSKPFEHQLKVFESSKNKEFFGLFMEMGTGKTKVTIDTIGHLYVNNKIEIAIIIAPNGVHRNWIDEIDKHFPKYIKCMALSKPTNTSSNKFKERIQRLLSFKGLKIFTCNYEFIISKLGRVLLNQMTELKCITILDESTRIKNPSSTTTRCIIKLASRCNYRRILTGSPVTQGPLDLFCQFWFLHPKILNFAKFIAYRAYVSNMITLKNVKTKQGKDVDVVGSYNAHAIKEIKKKISPHIYRVLKKDCLDLPEKIYKSVYVELTDEQTEIYRQLKEELMASLTDDVVIKAPLMLTRCLRFRQLLGGFLPTESGDIYNFNPNPRLDALIQIIEEAMFDNSSIIIWSCFVPEIEAIYSILSVKYKDNVVCYYGKVSDNKREEAKNLFQSGERKIFIGNPQAAGLGLTLTAASVVVYYSNAYSLEQRLQSEDRAHRIGQKKNVLYVDLTAKGTIDERVIQALLNKKSIANLLTGDNIKNLV